MRRHYSLILMVLAATTAVFGQIKEQEVILSGQAWRYSRVYPLLDGLFQDVASTQLKSLILDPNASNGTSLDALQQSIQFQVQYSQLAGIQNAAAAQTITANTGFQTQLLQQQTTLLQAQLLAQQQVGDAQRKLDALPSTADPNTIAAAKQAVTIALDNLNALTAQVALVKGQQVAPVYSPSPSASSLVPSQLPTPASIPSSLSTSATASTPSFPATKQMDNQMELLWERLSRLVGSMARPDSLEPNANLYLVEFDTGIFPEQKKRKHQLLDTTYTLQCTTGTGTPSVLDMFPRAAAVNITNVKYRDTSFGIGALLSFFGVGISGSYNREHLKLSQLLGQSSYITGHGVGHDEFGWLFGIAVGDDQISSDTRKTFVLVEVPSSCTSASVGLKSALWSSKPAPTNAALSLVLQQPTQNTFALKSISYNRLEYDQAAVSSTNPAGVTLRIELDQDMDQQESISVNGIPIRRARDTFGRATTAAGSGGLLESATLGINTWIPSGPRTLIITLDASMFGERFPLILLASPADLIDVSKSVTENTNVFVSGRKLKCSGSPCTLALPSLGFAKSSPKHFGVARLIGGPGGKDRLSITVADPPTSQPSPAGTPSGLPSIQVVSIADNQIWGSSVSVTVLDSNGDATQIACDPPQTGSRLICDSAGSDPKSNSYLPVQLEIVDTGHAGGPIKGLVDLAGCSNLPTADNYCRQPLIWDMKQPQLDTSDASHPQWIFDVLLVNVDANRKARFEGVSGNLDATIQCASSDGICTARFRITPPQFSSIKDLMKLQIEGSNGKNYPATIVNLFTNIRPVITQIDPDKASWYGQNFVFSQVKVGDTGAVYSISCSQDASTCHLKGKYGPKDAGYLYFVNEPQLVGLVQLNNSGGLTPIFLDLPVKPAAPGSTGPPTKGGGGVHALFSTPVPPPPPTVTLNKSLSMRAIQ